MGLTWKAAFSVVVIATQVSLSIPGLVACECGPTPPPCEAYSRSLMVFLGTVTEALHVQDPRVKRFRMHIDRAYKGVSESELILFDDGMCDGPELLVGQQYLMYTSPSGGGDVPARGCTRSRHVKFADEDLSYLDGLRIAAPTARVLGQISNWIDGPESSKPTAGALVTLHGPEDTLTAFADSQGHYSFEDLKPGQYTVSASQGGFRMSYDLPKVPVEARGCAVMNLVLGKDWPATIAGRLIRPDNTPGPPEVNIALSGVSEGEVQPEPSFTETNERGEYSFVAVPPGRYKLAIHPNWFPVPEAPYPPIYWPAASTEDAASEIEIRNAAVSRSYDFWLPPEVKSAKVNGTVQLSDGKPAVGALIDVFKLPEEQICGHAFSDEAGHFSFTAMEGLEYSLTASQSGENPLTSRTLQFSLGKGPQPLTLVLDGAR